MCRLLSGLILFGDKITLLVFGPCLMKMKRRDLNYHRGKNFSCCTWTGQNLLSFVIDQLEWRAMSSGKCSRLLIVGFIVGHILALTAVAQPQEDEVLVREAARRFFEATQRKDLETLRSMWSEKAPELPVYMARVQQVFASVGDIELKDLAIQRVTLEGTKADLRVTVEMQAKEIKSGKPVAGSGRLNRTLIFVKEDGRWRLWQNEPSELALALALLSAKTKADQLALLKAAPELQTPDLIGLLKAEFENFRRQKDQAKMLVALEVIQFVAERSADEAELAFALSNLGVIYYSKSDYTRAVEMFQKQLLLGVTTSNPAMTVRTLINIGTVKRSQGDYAGALEFMLRGLDVAEKLGDKKILGAVWNSIGVVQRELGDLASALANFEKSLALSEALADKVAMSFALNNIGMIHGLQGNHNQALAYSQRTLKLGQDSSDKPMMANALNNIGISYYSLGEYEKALDYYRQTLALREELQDKRMAALTLNNIGVIYRERGDYARALEYYNQSLAIREALADQAGAGNVLNNIGIIHQLQGDFTQALRLASRVVEIANRVSSPELLWRGYELAGKAHSALKQFDEAERALSNSIETIEKMRHRVGGGEAARQKFFEDKLPPYIAMMDLLFNRSRPVDALTYAELAKARTLLDVLRNGRVQITKAMTAEEQRAERASNAKLIMLNSQIYEESQRPQPNRDRIAQLETDREKARLDHDAFLTNLYVRHPDLKVQRGETTPITPEEAIAPLPPVPTAFMEFVVAEDKSYLIVLTRDRKGGPLQINFYSINVTAKRLSEQVNTFRGMLAGRDFNYQETARQLYDLLIKPAEQQLKGKKILCIVPDKSLWELPFQALQSKPGVHVIEDFSLFYAPSLTVLREMRKKRLSAKTAEPQTRIASGATPSRSSRTSDTLLALGNPQLSRADQQTAGPLRSYEQLGPLPEAEKEVKTLARLYGAANSRILIGAEARESRVKLEAARYAILHFATHGLLDDRNPMFSQLTLAQVAAETQEDGLLEAREIINMDLTAQMAVLSACQMARGRVGAGEGVIGMSWAFFVAGVPTTVASQWKVDSASTTSLMIEFHRRLTRVGANPKTKETRAESLRQAALVLLRSDRYRHPFYWAGFVMVGDGL